MGVGTPHRDADNPRRTRRLGAPAPALRVIDLGKIGYAEAYEHQQRQRDEVIAAREATESGGAEAQQGDLGRLLLLEHDPAVITVSRRPTAMANVIATPEQLRRAGVEIAETDRGGDVTYHGPGQLVAYVMVDLNRLHLGLGDYLRLLEGVVIDVCRGFGVEAKRDPSATGVWAHGAKICAMGVRVRKWVTMHGLALNVTTNLDHFDLIVPCGLAGRSVTSLERELGEKCPSMGEVKSALASRLGEVLEERIHHRGTDSTAE